MSTRERKARKRAGIKFEHTPKVATPFLERQSIFAPIYDVARGWHQSARARKARADYLARQGVQS